EHAVEDDWDFADSRSSCHSDNASRQPSLSEETPACDSNKRPASSGPNPECGSATRASHWAASHILRADVQGSAHEDKRPAHRRPSAGENCLTQENRGRPAEYPARRHAQVASAAGTCPEVCL